jgi:uncharacterized protein (TIGR02058 family)
MSSVLFVQVGFGVDQHGQDVTKAACKAVKHAIEFNRRARTHVSPLLMQYVCARVALCVVWR